MLTGCGDPVNKFLKNNFLRLKLKHFNLIFFLIFI